MTTATSVLELVGNTPMVRLNLPSRETGATILAKCEFMNPNGSVKDRIGVNMVQKALQEGTINLDTTLIEPTSGNTGVALASVCASLGIKLVLTMPESMSIERRKLLGAYGATLVLSPESKGMQGAIDKANELLEKDPKAVMLRQFENKNNPQSHSQTAKEILTQTKSLDVFVAAVGTGGTLSGTAKTLRRSFKELHVVAVEPKKCAVLSGGKLLPHGIQGIGAGFVPKTLDTTIYNEVVQVSDEDAYQTARMLARKEGLLVGISSGANVFAAMQVAKRKQMKGKTIVTVLCDTGERYLSTKLFDE